MELSKDTAHMGGTPGFISIMHTWDSNLSYHPHIHLLSTSGGLDSERNWCQKKDEYFLPGRAEKIHDTDKLCYEGNAEKYRNSYEYQEMLNTCYEKKWVTIYASLLPEQKRL